MIHLHFFCFISYLFGSHGLRLCDFYFLSVLPRFLELVVFDIDDLRIVSRSRRQGNPIAYNDAFIRQTGLYFLEPVTECKHLILKLTALRRRRQSVRLVELAEL